MKRFEVFGTVLTGLSFIGCAGIDSTEVPSVEDEEVASVAEAIHHDDCNDDSNDFAVDFSNCTEFAGLGFIPLENARPLVPAEFTPTGDAENAIMVIRVANCQNVKIDNHWVGGGTVAQVGINIVPPEGDGDINNYVVFYDTDSKPLQKAMKDAGVKAARYEPDIKFKLDNDGDYLKIKVPSKADYKLEGPVVAPTAPAVVFSANWWSKNNGRVTVTKQGTSFPAIQFGAATMTLTAKKHGDLRDILGGPSIDFTLLDSYNTFATAHMVVDER